MEGKMNFRQLLLTGLGLIIGAAIMTYIGVLTGVNGKAATLTIIICLALGIFGAAPYFLLTKMACIKGSYYSIAKEGLGLTVGGLCQYMAISDLLFYVSYPISMTSYIMSVFPGVNKLAVSLIFMAIVFIICLSGIDVFAKVESLITVFMLIVVAIFVVFGVVYMVRAGVHPFAFMGAPDFSWDAVFKGVPIMIFYSYGYCNIFFYSSLADKPTKNVPRVMLILGAVVIAVWILVVMISTNVLPIEQTAGQPLTYVAQEILPKPLAYLFVFGGAMLAILTSYLAMIPGAAVGYVQATKEGWFPKFLMKKNKAGAPWVVYAFIMLVALILILLDVPLSAVFLEVALLNAVWIGTIAVSFLRIPKKHPELFTKESKITPRMFYIAAGAAVALNVYVFYLSVNTLPIQAVIVSLIMIAAFVVIARYRVKNNKIHTENNFTIEQ